MICPVAYHLQLPEALHHLRNVFHASPLKPHHVAVPHRADPIVVDTSCEVALTGFWGHWVHQGA